MKLFIRKEDNQDRLYVLIGFVLGILVTACLLEWFL